MNDELIPAPDFPHHFYWFNTQQPLSLLDDLSGYVVLVHFWSATSINCQHVLPTLHYLEQRFVDRSFLIICVHEARFSAENDSDQVQEEIRRFGLRHPVVVDEEREIWDAYGCRSWPYLALIDAGGCLRFQGAGEPDRERMAGAISFLLDDAAAAGEEPYMELSLEDHEPETSLEGLAFPAGVVVDAANDRLFVADTGHHRILAIGLTDQAVQTVVGTGRPGAADGELASASFHAPSGLALVGADLFVADTGNHLLRRIDLAAGTVETVLGTGRSVVDTAPEGAGQGQSINSPWGLTAEAGYLYVSAAGNHQIWRVALSTMRAELLAGINDAGQFDGPPKDAALSQPAGLSLARGRLAFVDSDADSLRCIDLMRGELQTLVRGERMPLAGEHVDQALAGDLQYPTAVVWHGEDLLVADTLNDKIRRWRPGGTLETLAVDVHRPADLCVVGDELYIADTGNHRIQRLGLGDCAVQAIAMTDLPRARTAFGTEYERAAAVELSATAEITLRIPMEMQEGTVLQPGTSASLETSNFEGYPLLVDGRVAPDIEDSWFMVRGLTTGVEGEGVIRLRLTYLSCEEPGRVCHMHERRIDLPVKVQAGGPTQADVVSS